MIQFDEGDLNHLIDTYPKGGISIFISPKKAHLQVEPRVEPLNSLYEQNTRLKQRFFGRRSFDLIFYVTFARKNCRSTNLQWTPAFVY